MHSHQHYGMWWELFITLWLLWILCCVMCWADCFKKLTTKKQEVPDDDVVSTGTRTDYWDEDSLLNAEGDVRDSLLHREFGRSECDDGRSSQQSGSGSHGGAHGGSPKRQKKKGAEYNWTQVARSQWPVVRRRRGGYRVQPDAGGLSGGGVGCSGCGGALG